MTAITNYTAFDSLGNPTVGTINYVNTGTTPSISTSPLTISYIYGANNKISSRTETVNGMIGTFSYLYAPDNSYTVTSNNNGYTNTEDYDANDNILNSISTDGIHTQTSTYTYTYDTNGNPFYAIINGTAPAPVEIKLFIDWKRL